MAINEYPQKAQWLIHSPSTVSRQLKAWVLGPIKPRGSTHAQLCVGHLTSSLKDYFFPSYVSHVEWLFKLVNKYVDNLV
jgi:hypothetical protein